MVTRKRMCQTDSAENVMTKGLYRAPDVIVALDGNMQHRRYASRKDDPPIMQSDDDFYFLSDEKLNSAKKHVEDCRSKAKSYRPSQSPTPVPSQALDACGDSYKASQEKGDGPDTHLHSSKGNMALVCRHDVPLYLCDIKTLGEQQFYAVALIRELASMLPAIATIGAMYDIACQLDRSIHLVRFCLCQLQRFHNLSIQHDILPDLTGRLSLALALFHAYGHQFPCQVYYNPRKRSGFGLSNGEGNERVWSLCTDTIGAERVMGVSLVSRSGLGCQVTLLWSVASQKTVSPVPQIQAHCKIEVDQLSHLECEAVETH